MVILKENNTELTAIVFDLGNVLLDYDPARFMFELGIPQEKIPRLVEIINSRPEWAEYDRGVLSADDIINLAVRDEPFLRREIKNYMKHYPECFSALTQNVELLYRAKEAGLKVYVLSNCPADVFDDFCKRFIFLQDLDGAIISGKYLINKPDQAIFKLLLKTYPEINPSHTLFVDDVKVNADAGRKAGLQALHLPARGAVADYLEFREE